MHLRMLFQPSLLYSVGEKFSDLSSGRVEFSFTSGQYATYLCATVNPIIVSQGLYKSAKIELQIPRLFANTFHTYPAS